MRILPYIVGKLSEVRLPKMRSNRADRKRGRVMDKLVEHAIRMLEIVEGENDFFRNDAKRQADIARAVYDTILRVQVLERKADRKTENSSEIPNNCEELNAYRECVKSRSFWDSKHCDGCYFDERCPFDEPKDEPQTEDEILREQCRAFMGIVEQTERKE